MARQTRNGSQFHATPENFPRVQSSNPPPILNGSSGDHHDGTEMTEATPVADDDEDDEGEHEGEGEGEGGDEGEDEAEVEVDTRPVAPPLRVACDVYRQVLGKPFV